MRRFRIILSVLLLLILIFMLALAGMVLLVDPNKYKPALIAQIYQKTGYRLEIPGKLSWQFYPLLSIHAPEVIVNEQGSKTILTRLQGVDLRARVWALVTGKGIVDGAIDVDNLEFKGIKAQHAKIRFALEKDTLNLKPISADLYGGTLTGEAIGNELQAVPSFSWNVALENIDIKPLIADATAQQAKILLSGKSNLTMNAKTSGRNKTDLIYHLDGVMAINVQNGALEGVDINYYVALVNALINRETPPNTRPSNSTPFTAATGTVDIVNGALTTHNGVVNTQSFTTEIGGNVNLINMDLNMAFNTKLTSRPNITIPIIVKGNINSPSIGLDMNAVQKMLIDRGIEQVKDKANETVQEKINDEIKDKVPEKAKSLIDKIL